ncbi:hypothetical protein OSTOST_20052, partial [Ostertagia ostertagi]
RIDVQKRLNNFQEYINKRALLEWVRITGCENPHKWKYDKLLPNLANAIVSYDFWKYFMSEGRKRLAEYNKDKGTKIAILKELTIKSSDQNNLGLLLRMKITDIYKAKGKPVPDMFIRRGMIHCRFLMRFDMNILKMDIRPNRIVCSMSEKEKEEFNERSRQIVVHNTSGRKRTIAGALEEEDLPMERIMEGVKTVGCMEGQTVENNLHSKE